MVNNHGDHKSPKESGCGTPSKWPNFMAYKYGVILITETKSWEPILQVAAFMPLFLVLVNPSKGGKHASWWCHEEPQDRKQSQPPTTTLTATTTTTTTTTTNGLNCLVLPFLSAFLWVLQFVAAMVWTFWLPCDVDAWPMRRWAMGWQRMDYNPYKVDPYQLQIR